MAESRDVPEHVRRALLMRCHREIERSAVYDAEALYEGRLDEILFYPPNAGFTAEERAALEHIKGNGSLKSAFRKCFASGAASCLFDLFCLLDGVSPLDEGEVELATPSPDAGDPALLHDEFLDTYWSWREVRPEKSWKLDIADE
jgi:hypothetical protein